MLLWCPSKLGDRHMGKNKPNKQDKPKDEAGLSIGIRLGIAGAIIVAISLSSGYVILQINQVPNPDSLLVPYFLTIRNPTNLTETMYLSINLESDSSIASQKDVTAYILLAPNHQLRGGEGLGYSDLPEYFMVIFDGTACPDDTSKKYGSQYACSIRLNKVSVIDTENNPEGVNFEGEGTIKFVTGGQFGILLGTNFNETTGTVDIIGSDGSFINIVSLEDAQQVALTRAALYLTIPLAVIGAAISLVPLIVGRK